MMIMLERHGALRAFGSTGTRNRAFSALVSAAWMQGHVEERKILPIDCDVSAAFHRAHIPHAIPFAPATAGLKTSLPPQTGVVSEEELTQFTQMLGIPMDATLVFYDNEMSLKATRAWWVFRQYGFPKDQLKVLDGGWREWIASNGKIGTGNPQISHDTSKPFHPQQAKEDMLVGLEHVQGALLDGKTQFIDTRSKGEYIGAISNGNRRVGHVPGAHHFEWMQGIDFEANGKFLPKHALNAQITKQFGLDKAQPVITYCQRGIRAAHTAFVLEELLGFENVKIYEDSMLEYLNRDDTDVKQS